MGQRFRAFGVHITVGVVISVLIALVIRRWYPDFLFWADGGLELLFLIVAIDLVLGPCLTLVVYNPVKPLSERVMDMSLVVVLQMVGLGYGLYSGYMARPVMLVFHDDKISSVRWSDLVEQDGGVSILEASQGVPLPWMFSPVPASAAELAGDLAYFMSTDIRPEVQVQRMRPLSSEWSSLVVQLTGQADPSGRVRVPYAGRYRDAVIRFSTRGDYIDCESSFDLFRVLSEEEA